MAEIPLEKMIAAQQTIGKKVERNEAAIKTMNRYLNFWVRFAALRLNEGVAVHILRAILMTAIVSVAANLASSVTHAQGAAVSSPARDAPPQLPSLRLARTLEAPNELSTYGMLQSGNSGLTWSPDGERLAAYVRNGLAIITWSPDGKYQHEIPRYNHFGLDSYILKFLSGHQQIITSPAAETNSHENEDAVVDKAFSILDAETGKVLQNIAGPHPGESAPKNTAIHMAVSPDERFVAVTYRGFADQHIGIYSTADWRRIADIDLTDVQPWVDPQGLVFSSDGKMLAVLHGRRGRVKLFETESWTLLRSFEAFPENPPPMSVAVASTLAFSPDGMMLAVASFSGGSWWLTSDKIPASIGSGTLTTLFPSEPLRIFKVDDCDRVASLGSFPGGLGSGGLVWSPKGDYLGFLDGIGDVRFWAPFHPGNSISVASIGRHSRILLFSKDGSQLVANFEGGVKLFDVISTR
jgi:WD40 repeat protein